MKLVYQINDRPGFGKMIVYAFQQLLAILAATIVVPVIVGHDMSQAAALFGAGVGTLIYVLCTKAKSPVFLGSSFAFLGSMAAAFAGGVSMSLGYLGLIIGAAFAGLVYVIIAVIVKFAGVKWIAKLMPAVVIGPTVAIIGLSLATNAIGDMQKANFIKEIDSSGYSVVEEYVEDEDGKSISDLTVCDQDGNEVSNVAFVTDADGNYVMTASGDYQMTETPGSIYVALICALITLAVTIICSVYGSKGLRLIPFIMGILAGYLAATIFYFIGVACGNDALKVIDYSAFTGLDFTKFESYFSIPDFTFLTAFKGTGELTPGYISSIALAYIPVAFVVFAEHIADHKNISTVVEKDLLVDPGLHRTLLGDGIGSMVGAFFGGCPNTTYGESIACVAITGNASVWTIGTAAVLAIIASFFTPFVAFLSTIPSCVMGGICTALYGFIAVSGLKMLKNVDLGKNSNLFVVSVILITGIGGLVVSFQDVTITTVAVALILGILTNLLVAKAPDRREDAESENTGAGDAE